jgi:MFS family permease
MADFREFKEGGGVVVAAMTGIALGLSPLPFYTLGLFAPHLARAFHWNQATIMSGLLAMTAVLLLAAPVVGWLADRYGVRRVTLVSVLLFGASFAGFAFQDGSVVHYYLTWGLIAAFGAGTLPITWTRAVNGWFEARKGLALGLSLAGTGLAAFLLKPFSALAIAHLGWRGGYLALAALPIVIAWPVAFALFREPRAASSSVLPSAGAGVTLSEALRDWRFWLIGGAFLPIAFAVGGPIPNLDLLFKTHGLAPGVAGSVLPLIGVFVIAGRLLGGWLIDRVWAPLVAVLMLSLPLLGDLSFLNTGATDWSAFLMVAGLGLAVGMEYDLLAFLTARYFGTRHYGAVYGTLYGFFAAGGGVAPSIYGHVYDASGTFDRILWWGGVVMAVGGLLLCGLGRYRYPPARG